MRRSTDPPRRAPESSTSETLNHQQKKEFLCNFHGGKGERSSPRSSSRCRYYRPPSLSPRPSRLTPPAILNNLSASRIARCRPLSLKKDPPTEPRLRAAPWRT